MPFAPDPNYILILESCNLVAWKRYYLEYDQMYKMGGTIFSGAGATLVVDNISDFAVGQTVIVFSNTGDSESAKIKSIVSASNTIEFDSALSRIYPRYSGVRLTNDSAGNSISGAADLYDIPNRDMSNAYGDNTQGADGGCFVEFVSGVLPGDSHIPKYTLFPDMDVSANANEVKGFCSHWKGSSTDLSSVYQLIATKAENHSGSFGVTFDEINTSILTLDEFAINFTSTTIGSAIHETTLHEIGHQWLTAGTDGSHPTSFNSRRNHMDNDDCLMSYSRNRADGIMEFDIPHLIEIRKSEYRR